MGTMDARGWLKLVCGLGAAFLATLVAGATNATGPVAEWIRSAAPVLGAAGAALAWAYAFLDRTVANATAASLVSAAGTLQPVAQVATTLTTAVPEVVAEPVQTAVGAVRDVAQVVTGGTLGVPGQPAGV